MKNKNKNLNDKRLSNLQFDELNLQQTNPIIKDYGYTKVNQKSTPFPRTIDPVTPGLLRQRLERLLTDLNISSHKCEVTETVPTAYNMLLPGYSSGTIKSFKLNDKLSGSDESDKQQSWRSQLFKKKRQEFYRGEYLITKQRSMRYLKHEAGKKIDKDRTLTEKDSVTYRATINYESRIHSMFIDF